MKRFFFLFLACITVFQGFAQKPAPYTEDDVMQFYRTLQGDYTAALKDSTTLSLHITPIWEREDSRYQWFYMEVVENETQKTVEQKILEIVPSTAITFKVRVHGIKKPELFAGKWSNRNFFDGFNTSILKRSGKFMFLKTKDFDYQTVDWYRRKTLKCFPSGDRIHFKFSQEDERLYIKRLLRKTSHLDEIVFFKIPTD